MKIAVKSIYTQIHVYNVMIVFMYLIINVYLNHEESLVVEYIKMKMNVRSV